MSGIEDKRLPWQHLRTFHRVLHGANFMQLVLQGWEERSIASCGSYGTRCNVELQTSNSFKTTSAIVAESKTDLYFVQS